MATETPDDYDVRRDLHPELLRNLCTMVEDADDVFYDLLQVVRDKRLTHSQDGKRVRRVRAAIRKAAAEMVLLFDDLTARPECDYLPD